MARQLGTPFMPWQQFVADVAGEVDPATGRLWYREVVLIVPRQSGKTTLILGEAVHRANAFGGPQRIVYTAQTRNDARAKWEDEHVAALDLSIFKRRKQYRVRKTNGNEAILWRNGSRHGIAANTEKSGHGGTLDLAFVDEAFSQADARLEQAFKPAQITRPEPQLWVVSTPGKSAGSSPYLWAKVEAGRQRCQSGEPSRVAYIEWSAPEGADRADPATWLGCMPALGHTITVDAIQADFNTMEPAEFDRAYLCWWNPHSRSAVIDEDQWNAAARPGLGLLDPVTFAIDVTPDGLYSSIVAAGDSRVRQGKRRVTGTLVEHIAHGPGTGWVVDRLAKLIARHGPRMVVLDPSSPAGALIPALVEAGITFHSVTTREHAQAAEAFRIGIVEQTIWHLAQPALGAARSGAVRRKVTDSWLWSRTSSAVDISPLVAAGLAAWGHRQPIEDDGGDTAQDFAIVV